MPRRKLTDLIEGLAPDATMDISPVAPPVTPTEPAPPPTPDPLTRNKPGPKYLGLERKDVRFHADQLDALTKLSRKLNRKRRGVGERLTENTLIRVAVDFLLANEAQLGGTTEDEIRAALGLPPRGV